MDDLGKLQGIYKSSPAVKAALLVCGLIFCAVPILIIAVRVFSEAQDFPAFSTIFTIVGIPAGLLGIVSFRLILWTNIFQVRIYENGIFSTDKDGEHQAGWAEIEDLGVTLIRQRMYGMPVRRSCVLTVTKTNRESFIISPLIKNAEEIRTRLVHETNIRRIPVYRGSRAPEYYEQMFH